MQHILSSTVNFTLSLVTHYLKEGENTVIKLTFLLQGYVNTTKSDQGWFNQMFANIPHDIVVNVRS